MLGLAVVQVGGRFGVGVGVGGTGVFVGAGGMEGVRVDVGSGEI